MKIRRFINTPVSSNTYLITNDNNNDCVLVDPGTKGCEDIIDCINNNKLVPIYILLTHSDFDHIWGVNTLKKTFPNIKIVASKETARMAAIPQSYFSALYFGNSETYCVDGIDYIVDEHCNMLQWGDVIIRFLQTPGHTTCSNVIIVNDLMFSGDTILKDTKPYIKKRHGGNKEVFQTSIKMIFDVFPDNIVVYPGHGEMFRLGEVRGFYEKYLDDK